MVTEARETRRQIEQTTFFAPESVGKFLFPKEPDKIHFINELKPSPHEDGFLVILRIGQNETPVRSFFLGLRDEPLEKMGREGKAIGNLLQDYKEDFHISIRRIRKVVVFFDKKTSLESKEGEFKNLVNQLSPEARIWLLEPDLIRVSQDEKESKKDYLQRIGLVDRKSVSTKSGLCYSTGRLPKKGERIPANLTSTHWFEPVLKGVVKEYEEAGWRVTSTSEVEERLKRSTFVPDDVSKLKLGYGIKIEAPCGCTWRVDFEDGAWEREKRCHDEGCEGYPPPKPKPEEKPKKTKEEVLCYKCHQPMDYDPKRKIHSCPTCTSRYD